MSTRILILKDGVITPSRSSGDISNIVTSLGLTKSSVGLNLVDNTSDLSKPISTATQTALNLKANLISPALTGTPTVPTATAGTNTTQIANTAFVSTAISNLVASSPAALDTLNELATALGNDANFSTTVTNSLASKVDTTNTQNVSGDKYFLDSVLVGINSSLAIQPYDDSNIKSINSLQVVNSSNGSITLTANPASTFVFANNDFEINASTSINITNQFLGSHVRVRNYGTGLTSNIQGIRLTALNSGGGNITTLDGAAFTARNDTATTVTTINGGNFAASIGNIPGTATIINGGLFTVSSGAPALSTTVRGILVNASSSNTTPAISCIGIEIANITGTATNKFAIKTGSGIVSFGDTTASTSTTTGAFIVSGGIGADHIKTKNAWLLESPSGANIINANTLSFGQYAGTKWIDGSVNNVNFPVNAGMLTQFDALFNTASANLYKVQEFTDTNNFWKRCQVNGSWGAWRQITFV